MRSKTILVSLLIGYCVGLFANSAKGEIVDVSYSDGHVHTINQPMNDTRVFCSGDSTTVDVVNGGAILDLFTIDNSRGMLSGGTILNNVKAYGNSRVEMTGGTIGEYGGPNGALDAYDESQIMVSGGSMNLLEANGHSQATISDGMTMIAAARENSQLTVYGGAISNLAALENGQVAVYGMSSTPMLPILVADNEGIITLHGYEFYDDSQQIGYGKITSIFGGDWGNEPERHIAVRLENGEFYGASFYLGHNSSIVLVPEPATLLLLGLGAVVLRKTP